MDQSRKDARLVQLAVQLDPAYFDTETNPWEAVGEFNLGLYGTAMDRLLWRLGLDYDNSNLDHPGWVDLPHDELARVILEEIADVVGPYWWLCPREDAHALVVEELARIEWFHE